MPKTLWNARQWPTSVKSYVFEEALLENCAYDTASISFLQWILTLRFYPSITDVAEQNNYIMSGRSMREELNASCSQNRSHEQHRNQRVKQVQQNNSFQNPNHSEVLRGVSLFGVAQISMRFTQLSAT